MKSSFFYSILIFFILISCSQKKNLNMEGAWKIVQIQSITGDKVVTDFPGKDEVDVVKIWSGNHFMEVGRLKSDTIVTNDYAYGTFKLDGTSYEEHVKYHFYKPYEGTTVKLSLVFRNDTLIQTYPVDDKGQPDKNGAWVEKYIKIKGE